MDAPSSQYNSDLSVIKARASLSCIHLSNKMKLLVACIVLMVVVAVHSERLPQATAEELRNILSTRAGAQEFVDCVKRPKTCRDNRAHGIARLAPSLIRTQGRCKKVKGLVCTPQDEENIKIVVSTLSSKYNDLYNDLLRSLVREA
ncbi:Insect odorant-binding protein A10/Ejaculatory bulb-specific protein 3 [Trinorchestia longiramus]|nr:Insect odorant-binding protein A10/Ejaculatory bulb-specific protein 3 [Trinorchestia longiramus]